MDKNNQNIQLAAYYLWQNSGCPEGRSEEFWYAAIKQINGNSCGKKCFSSTTTSKKSCSSRSTKAKNSLK